MLPTKEDNYILLKEYKKGNIYLKEKIITNNMSLVHSLVNRYKHPSSDHEDLLQIGCIGLLKAIENFDQSYNVQFSTYAVPLILGEIKKYYRDNGLIKVSRSLKELNLSINKLKNDHYLETGKELSIEELSEKLHTTKYDIIMAMETNYLPSSLEDPIYEKNNSKITLEETIKDESCKNILDILTLQDSLKLLTDKEKLFINLRYYKEMNQQAIANKFNISQVQVSRFEKKIIEKLKKHF